jgi:Seryl-tRNA synthetase
MIDSNLFKSDAKSISQSLKHKNYDLDINTFKILETDRKKFQTLTEELQSKRKLLSKEYGDLKKIGTTDPDLIKKIESIKNELNICSENLLNIQSSLRNFLLDIPNIPHKSVPNGKNEENNVVIREFGEPKISGGKDHLDITSMIDLETANLLAGSRFSVLNGEIAKLHRSLITYMLDKASEHGYLEHYLPMIANTESLTSTGQLPKFFDDLFQLTDDYYLIPTAEVPLTNIFRDQIIDFADLPLKLSAHTSCFRSEAGSYGKDPRGLIRQHQLKK